MSTVLQCNRAHCYAELVSSLAWSKPSPVLTALTHGGMARLSGPECGLENTLLLYPPKVVTNPNTIRA